MSSLLKCMGAGLAAAVVSAVAVVPASAASVSYPGPIVVENGFYDSLVETSITDTPPLYGPPTVGAGNTLTFDTTANFSASVTGEGSDITSGALEFTFQAEPGELILTLSLFETGTYEIVNYGGVSAGGALTVRYLDELTQHLVTLADPIHTVLSPNGIPGAPGDAPGGDFPYIGSGTGDWIGAALIDFGELQVQTSYIIVALDNTLIAQACDCGSATIRKDELTVNITTIPEPASLALMGMGLGMIVGRKRG